MIFHVTSGSRWMNRVSQVTEGRFVRYFGVSAARQGRSGLRLEAQKETVALFLNGGRWDGTAGL